MNNLLKVALLMSFFISSLFADVKGIDTKELIFLKSKGIKIIDIRKVKEIHKTGIIPSSYRLSFYKKNGKIDKNKWLHSFVSLISNTSLKFVLISKDGELAKKGANLLKSEKNYKNSYYLIGGIKEWINSDLKTIKVKELPKLSPSIQ